MTPAQRAMVILWLGILGLFVVAFYAFAQPVAPPPVPTQAYLEQRLHDLKEYRDYLEDQLAAAKALIGTQRKQLDECQKAKP